MLPVGDGWAQPDDDVRLYGSGRQALLALLESGKREHGWRALHIPDYYCPEVVSDAAGVLPVSRYDVGPMSTSASIQAEDQAVVVAVSYFGAPPVIPQTPPGVRTTLVIDASHDPRAPWLSRVPADYVFVSLRKTMPLPDGGALWAPTSKALPPCAPLTDTHRVTTSHALSAMCLKAAYLAGAPIEKDRYLELYAACETSLCGASISGISEYSRQALRALALDDMWRRRAENGRVFAMELGSLPGVTVQAFPFGIVLECESHSQREALRRSLIEHRVYPAVLWTLPPSSPPHHYDFSLRMLFLHCDSRWNSDDMLRAADLVRDLLTQLLEGTPC
jgi:hypothetical protein